MDEARGNRKRSWLRASLAALVVAGLGAAGVLVSMPEPADALDAALVRSQVAKGAPVFVRIFKQESELELWAERGGAHVLLKTYPVCTWSGTLGPKLREGDRQSPEGFYRVTRQRLNPNSRFHLSFNVGFPNAYDRAHGRTGSFLMVHGNCVSLGCYAMTDAGIEEIYGMVEAALDGGQPSVQVHIFPFRMTDAEMRKHGSSKWIGFWRNLKQGYDAFETHGRPPEITVEGGVYRVAGVRAGRE